MGATTARIARILTELPVQDGVTVNQLVFDLLLVAANVNALRLTFEPGDGLRDRTGTVRCVVSGRRAGDIPGVYRTVFRSVLAAVAIDLPGDGTAGRIQYETVGRVVKVDVEVANSATTGYVLGLTRVATATRLAARRGDIPAKGSTIIFRRTAGAAK